MKNLYDYAEALCNAYGPEMMVTMIATMSNEQIIKIANGK